MHSVLNDLQKIAFILKKNNTDYEELTQAIFNFKSIVQFYSELSLENQIYKEDLYGNRGKSIGTTWAAMCLEDMIRTKIFIKGIFKAIEKIKTTAPIHILYAGTGPFATLLLPILASYSPSELQATLIEINPHSFDCMQKLIKKIGFEDHIIAFENKDAMTYSINSKFPVDIILSETLQAGLSKEQQVPITLNLLKQVSQNTILIPEKISLDICLINYLKFTESGFPETKHDSIKKLETLIEINNQSHNKLNISSPIVAKKMFTLSKEDFINFTNIALLTNITVFENEKIKCNESGLTVPVLLESITEQQEKTTFTVSYIVDTEIDYKFEWNN